MRMDFVTLKLFVAIAEEGSIGRASVLQNMVASAGSKRIALLEEDLGVALLVRHTKGVSLTPAGETLLHRSRDILRSVETTGREISEFANDGHAQIRLSANHSSLVQFLPSDIGSFLASHPRVTIDIVERLSADVVRAVVDGMADVGIFCWPVVHPGLLVFPYRTDELALAVPASHALAGTGRVAFSDAEDYEFIAYFPHLTASAAVPEFLSHANYRVRIHVANIETTCRMVEKGLGIALLPLGSLQALPTGTGLVYVRLTDSWAQRQFHVCMRRGGPSLVSVEALVQHLSLRAKAA